MASRLEILLAAAVIVTAGILVLLLAIPSIIFFGHIRSAVGAVRDFVVGTTTTTSTTSTSATSTTAPLPRIVSTSTLRTTTFSTVPAPAITSTTTTLRGRRCNSNEECGGVVSELKCKKNSVWNYTTTYSCRERGTPYSQCLGAIRSEVVRRCKDYQDCLNGACVETYDNECEYACDQDGYDIYYCSRGNCSAGDVTMRVDEECSTTGSICCCLVA